jgi:hypothetical protein
VISGAFKRSTNHYSPLRCCAHNAKGCMCACVCACACACTHTSTHIYTREREREHACVCVYVCVCVCMYIGTARRNAEGSEQHTPPGPETHDALSPCPSHAPALNGLTLSPRHVDADCRPLLNLHTKLGHGFSTFLLAVRATVARWGKRGRRRRRSGGGGRGGGGQGGEHNNGVVTHERVVARQHRVVTYSGHVGSRPRYASVAAAAWRHGTGGRRGGGRRQRLSCQKSEPKVSLYITNSKFY